MLERKLDAFAQPVARRVEAADIVPADRRRFDHHFAHRRRLHALQRIDEIVRLDRQCVEHFGRDRVFVEVELGHDPANGLERRLAGQGGKIGADESVGLASQLIEVHVGVERHAAGVDAENLAAALLVGNADDDLAVEAAGAAKRLVDRFGPIGGGDDDQILPRLQPVQQAQQLGDEALFRLAGDLAALGSDRIDLVDEDDRRRGLGRMLEQLAKLLLALAIGRAHDLRAGDVEEFGVAFIGDGAREPGLAGAGRAMEQNALGRIDAEALEQFGMAKRQLDHLAQRVDRVAHPAEVVVGDVRAALAVAFAIFRQQLDLGVVVDVDDVLGRRADDQQAHFLQSEGRSVQHLPDFFRQVGIDPLVAGGGDDIAFRHRSAREAALQGVRPSPAGGYCPARARTRLAWPASTAPSSPRHSRPSRRAAFDRCRPSRRMMSSPASSG